MCRSRRIRAFHGDVWNWPSAVRQASLRGVQEYPLLALGLFVVAVNGVLFRIYMGRVFTYLDPAEAVPTHVRSTLDTFAEGVIVLDRDRRIVLTNEAFTRQAGVDSQQLLGRNIASLPWEYLETTEQELWDSPEMMVTGVPVELETATQGRRTFLVNTSAILSGEGEQRGLIVSFDDITLMEEKQRQLGEMLQQLQKSRDELSQRNKELQFLATRDPLTGCLNRRTFFDHLDTCWNAAQRYQHNLACIMVDVDHFKSVNDNHGHSMGDEVLRRVGKAIASTARSADIVCRYGGEEFTVLLPNTDIDDATVLAERIRSVISELQLDKLCVTASLGVSSLAFGAPGCTRVDRPGRQESVRGQERWAKSSGSLG